MAASPDSSIAAQLGRIPGFDISKRVVMLGILVMIMMIPLTMIGDLINERSYRRYDVENEIAGQWGGFQIVGGPVLMVPYVTRSTFTRNDGSTGVTVTERTAFFLPQALAIEASLNSELRRRSLHEVLVYTSDIELTGSFAPANFAEWAIPSGDIKWNDAMLLFGVSDIKGIVDLDMSLAGRTLVPASGPVGAKIFQNGLQARVSGLQAGKPHDFAVKLSLNGSGSLQFLPMGSSTEINLASDWPDPSFIGTALPQARTIKADGFQAHWQTTYISRPYPAQWRAGDLSTDLQNSAFGVALTRPGDVYQQSDRIAKYGLMVIGLTFATIFVVGLLTDVRAHMVQYLLVGGSICIFYLLVLALSEQIRFDFAYGIASAVDIAVVALYVARTVRRLIGVVTAIVLALIHGWMFVLLQMEDYVLLSGTVGLLLALITVMYVTRNVDWYRIGAPSAATAVRPAD
jgi:inner membrane protein